MESSHLLKDFLSPESTVTSLLSSSGHLRSSLRRPDQDSTFRYRDREYDSASAALDAYIADFERSRQKSESSLTGSLVLPHSPPSMPYRPGAGAIRNKDVLRERLTDRELDFLNLPVSSLRHRANRDRLSMTTDELLNIPHDGSMPVTHTSAFIQGFLSQFASSEPSSKLLHHHSLPTRTSRSSRCRDRPGLATFKPDDHIRRSKRSEWVEPSMLHHLPHRADMDCSGMTSMPDLKYPAWIRSRDLSEPPPTHSELWDNHDVLPPGAPRTGAPSWVADLEKDDDPDQLPSQVGSQQALRDLRLQFAEQISLLAAERKSSDVVTTLYRDNRIESLIQKADRVLTSLSRSSGQAETPAEPASPVNTEELLLRSPSCRPPDSAAADLTEEQPDRGAEGCEPGFWKQPGPVEALKQMLFRLQAVEAELQRQQRATPAAPAPADLPQTPPKQRPDEDADLHALPGSPSLQRALYHLSRLKLLVEEPREKRSEQEKDDDEGRYSSSSADGPVCSRQEA